MSDNFIPTAVEQLRFAPEIILTIAGAVVMVLEGIMFKQGKDEHADRGSLGYVAIIGLVAAMVAAVIANGEPGLAFQGMIITDGFATFFRLLVMAVGILTVLTSTNYLSEARANSGDFYALILFSVVGQSLMACANELIMIFIGIEISSIASYILAGYLRDDRRNNESALKYFLMGSFATAFLLYGVAWIYGITGSTNLGEIRTVLAQGNAPAFMVGVSAALMLVGLAFKVSAAPFQIWAPDVYQGAPAPISAFMSAGPKAAAFAVMLRVFLTSFDSIGKQWEPVLWIMSLATMVIGNFAALQQSNIKRMLAYSSIAHAGYVMVAVTSHSAMGTSAAMFYLASYCLMNIGAFAVVTWMARNGEKYVDVDDFSGLAQKQPFVTGILTILILSLVGVPLTAGFFGKFLVFKAAIDSHLIWLAVLGLLNSAVAAFYYLRLLVVMYFREPHASTNNLPPVAGSLRLAMIATVLGTVVLGIFPGLITGFANSSSALGK